MTSNKTSKRPIRRRNTDLSPSDIEARLRGAHTFDQVKSEYDLPEPDYVIRGKPFWTADIFEPWIEKYLSDGKARVKAHEQWLECEEARLRAESERKEAAERIARENEWTVETMVERALSAAPKEAEKGQ